ncbi:MAG: hypothetical protein HFG17_03140 [Oscillospiraceae bacterium]|nr:hypothetical protein [Oscillospiraceae bacterium]
MDLKKQIAYLNGYQDAEREGERTKQEFLFWKRRIQEISEETGNPQAAQWEAYYCKMLQGRYRKCLQARLLVEKAILQASPGRERTLLRMRYIDGLSMEACAERLGLCDRHLQRVHKQILESLQLPEFFPVQDRDFVDRMACLAGFLCQKEELEAA